MNDGKRSHGVPLPHDEEPALDALFAEAAAEEARWKAPDADEFLARLKKAGPEAVTLSGALSRGKSSRNWFRLAAAALLVGAGLGIVVLSLVNREGPSDPTPLVAGEPDAEVLEIIALLSEDAKAATDATPDVAPDAEPDPETMGDLDAEMLDLLEYWDVLEDPELLELLENS